MYAPPVPASTDDELPIRTADWVELNLVTQEEDTISVTSVADALADTPLDETTADEHRDEYADASEDLEPSVLKEGFWKRAEGTAELAFQELLQRSRWLGSRYPLALDSDTVSRNRDFDSTIVARFLSLLRSRHLYHDALQDNGEAAGQLFEELLPHALRRYVNTARRHALRFGVAGGSRGDDLPSDTDAALDALAQRTNESRGSFSGMADGRDFGGDSIVWKPFDDSLPGQLVTVGQSTISERKWIRKQPSPKWRDRRLVKFLTPPMTVVAFVETMSLASKTLLAGLGDEFSSLPFDRLRLLGVLRDTDLPCPLRTRMDAWSCSMQARLSRENGDVVS